MPSRELTPTLCIAEIFRLLRLSQSDEGRRVLMAKAWCLAVRIPQDLTVRQPQYEFADALREDAQNLFKHSCYA
jgi:hypothetical protein